MTARKRCGPLITCLELSPKLLRHLTVAMKYQDTAPHSCLRHTFRPYQQSACDQNSGRAHLLCSRYESVVRNMGCDRSLHGVLESFRRRGTGCSLLTTSILETCGTVPYIPTRLHCCFIRNRLSRSLTFVETQKAILQRQGSD